MEHGFGTDFGAVRLHAGPDVRRLNRRLDADGFTVGSDIFLDKISAFADPESQSLLAHELTHVVQQRGGERIQRMKKKHSNSALGGPSEDDLYDAFMLLVDAEGTGHAEPDAKAILAAFHRLSERDKVVVTDRFSKEGLLTRVGSPEAVDEMLSTAASIKRSRMKVTQPQTAATPTTPNPLLPAEKHEELPNRQHESKSSGRPSKPKGSSRKRTKGVLAGYSATRIAIDIERGDTRKQWAMLLLDDAVYRLTKVLFKDPFSKDALAETAATKKILESLDTSERDQAWKVYGEDLFAILPFKFLKDYMVLLSTTTDFVELLDALNTAQATGDSDRLKKKFEDPKLSMVTRFRFAADLADQGGKTARLGRRMRADTDTFWLNKEYNLNRTRCALGPVPGNHAVRKACRKLITMRTRHRATASGEKAAVKLADLIDNHGDHEPHVVVQILDEECGGSLSNLTAGLPEEASERLASAWVAVHADRAAMGARDSAELKRIARRRSDRRLSGKFDERVALVLEAISKGDTADEIADAIAELKELFVGRFGRGTPPVERAHVWRRYASRARSLVRTLNSPDGTDPDGAFKKLRVRLGQVLLSIETSLQDSWRPQDARDEFFAARKSRSKKSKGEGKGKGKGKRR